MQLSPAAVQAFHCPRWHQLPALSLYMDQVVIVLEEVLGLFTDEGETALTPSMVNNYVKQGLLPPPEKKKYARQHIAALVQVSMLKRVLSMSEITALMAALTQAYGLEAGYDSFCEELEQSLLAVFGGSTGAELRFAAGQGAAALLGAALAALCGKLFVQNYLAVHAPSANKPKTDKPKKEK